MTATKSSDPIYQQIRDKIEAELAPDKLIIRDDSHKHKGHSGYNAQGASHLHITIVADAFNGVSRIARYRVVYDLLAEELRTRIHALSLDLKTKYEYEK